MGWHESSWVFKKQKKADGPTGSDRFLQARIAQRIEKFWNKPVKDSANLLINNVIKDSETRPASSAAAWPDIAEYTQPLFAAGVES